MQPLRLAPTLALSAVLLFACDPEQDFADDASADELELGSDDSEPMLGDMPSELVELELEAASNEQTTEEESWCSVWGPSEVLANNQKIGTAEIGIAAAIGTYDFDLIQNYLPHFSSFNIKRTYSPYAVVASSSANLGWYPFPGRTGDTFNLTLQAPANAAPGAVYSGRIKLNGGGQCTDYWFNLRIADCRTVGWWSTNPWPTPWFDNANCYVAALPPGQTSFVHNNSWYVQETAGNQCAVGVFDGANCYIGSAPGGHTAFIWNNALYYTP